MGVQGLGAGDLLCVGLPLGVHVRPEAACMSRTGVLDEPHMLQAHARKARILCVYSAVAFIHAVSGDTEAILVLAVALPHPPLGVPVGSSCSAVAPRACPTGKVRTRRRTAAGQAWHRT